MDPAARALENSLGIVTPEVGDPDGPDRLEQTTLRPEPSQRAQVTAFKLLVIVDEEPVSHPLPTEGDVTIGRSEAADIQVADPLISRVHAVIHLGPQLAVTDLGSSNGTIVRGEKIAPDQRVAVSVGEVIDFGSTIVIVQREVRRQRDASDPVPAPTSSTVEPSDSMVRLHKLVKRIAASRINVLLLGETGVGKEVMAHTVHRLSARAAGPFLGLNCAALSDQLFESELFGFERGAFTGANRSKPGLIETADGGTLFLDEVGEMPLAAQAKLLRVLEGREVFRVGGLKSQPVDVRFVAATNRNLEAEVAAGRFREDLYYRLNGITLVIPPLRERRSEILGLARSFIAEACREAGYESTPRLSADATEWMEGHDWPGNIRELKNVINRAVLLATGGSIQVDHLAAETHYRPRASSAPQRPPTTNPEQADDVRPPSKALSAEQLAQREQIVEALRACGGNQTRAAKLLEISRRTLSTRLDELDIPRPRKR